MFTSRGWGRKNDRLRLESAWATAAGAELLKDTAVLGFKRGARDIPAVSAELTRLAGHKAVVTSEPGSGAANGRWCRDLCKAGWWARTGDWRG